VERACVVCGCGGEWRLGGRGGQKGGGGAGDNWTIAWRWGGWGGIPNLVQENWSSMGFWWLVKGSAWGQGALVFGTGVLVSGVGSGMQRDLAGGGVSGCLGREPVVRLSQGWPWRVWGGQGARAGVGLCVVCGQAGVGRVLVWGGCGGVFYRSTLDPV